jgi:hypothetical protein
MKKTESLDSAADFPVCYDEKGISRWTGAKVRTSHGDDRGRGLSLEYACTRRLDVGVPPGPGGYAWFARSSVGSAGVTGEDIPPLSESDPTVPPGATFRRKPRGVALRAHDCPGEVGQEGDTVFDRQGRRPADGLPRAPLLERTEGWVPRCQDRAARPQNGDTDLALVGHRSLRSDQRRPEGDQCVAKLGSGVHAPIAVPGRDAQPPAAVPRA